MNVPMNYLNLLSGDNATSRTRRDSRDSALLRRHWSDIQRDMIMTCTKDNTNIPLLSWKNHSLDSPPWAKRHKPWSLACFSWTCECLRATKVSEGVPLLSGKQPSVEYPLLVPLKSLPCPLEENAYSTQSHTRTVLSLQRERSWWHFCSSLIRDITLSCLS